MFDRSKIHFGLKCVLEEMASLYELTYNLQRSRGTIAMRQPRRTLALLLTPFYIASFVSVYQLHLTSNLAWYSSTVCNRDRSPVSIVLCYVGVLLPSYPPLSLRLETALALTTKTTSGLARIFISYC
jgi:hypothetical protein